MIREDTEERYVGAVALDEAESSLGTVRQVYVDDETDRPLWASVRVDLLGSEVLVPLDDAAWDEEVLRLAIRGPVALEAPRCAGMDAPTARDQERLYTHYGIPTLRTPRSAESLLEVDDGEVCYSVHCDADARPLGEAITEAEAAVPETVSGHMTDETSA